MKNIPEEFQKDYIRTMRKMIGHAPLVMTACGVLIEIRMENYSYSAERIMDFGGFPEGQWNREKRLRRLPEER